MNRDRKQNDNKSSANRPFFTCSAIMPKKIVRIRYNEIDNRQQTRYDSIQLMRGIAALSVVITHIIMVSNGAFGVDLFFCISGFIMMYITEKGGKKFLLKRAVRIIPLYWIAIFATVAMLVVLPQYFRKQVFSLPHLFKSMFFIPSSIVGNGGEAWSIVEVGWTLICEVFFYIVFYISLKINHKNRHIISGCILAFVVVIGFIFGSNTDSDFIRFYCRPIMLEFVLGMILFKLLVSNNNIAVSHTKDKRDYWKIILAVLIWAFLFTQKYIPFFSGVDRLIIWGLPVFAFFVLIFKFFEHHRVPKPLIVLGDISYSLYLTHTFVVQPFSRLIYNIDVYSPIGVILTIFVVIPLCLGVAWVSWYLIENRVTGYLRKKLKI